MQHDNADDGDTAFNWADFDALPSDLQELLRSAPYSYGTSDLVMALRSGRLADLPAFVAQLRQTISAQVREQVFTDYGPKHPQFERPVW